MARSSRDRLPQRPWSYGVPAVPLATIRQRRDRQELLEREVDTAKQARKKTRGAKKHGMLPKYVSLYEEAGRGKTTPF